jgi:transcriptional regulator GlxA family with amidase domain
MNLIDSENAGSPTGILRVGFLLMPEFTLLAFTSFVEALRIAADEWDRSRQIACRWSILSPDSRPIRASCGVDVRPNAGMRSPQEFDYIVVVGGLLRGHGSINRDYYDYIAAAHQRGCPVVGLCTGSFVLARAGLLAGRRCSVHWFHEPDFRREFPHVDMVSNDLFVLDGKTITCAGGTGAFDLAVHLITTHCGMSRALKSMEFAMVDRIRDHHEPIPRSHAQCSDECDDPLIRRAVAIVNQRIDRQVEIESLASQLNLSVRQLERHFQRHTSRSPMSYIRGLRLRHADWLVQNSRRSMTDIAVECGFTDASHFSRCYRMEFGRPPSEVRGSARTQADRRPALAGGHYASLAARESSAFGHA